MKRMTLFWALVIILFVPCHSFSLVLTPYADGSRVSCTCFCPKGGVGCGMFCSGCTSETIQSIAVGDCGNYYGGPCGAECSSGDMCYEYTFKGFLVFNLSPAIGLFERDQLKARLELTVEEVVAGTGSLETDDPLIQPVNFSCPLEPGQIITLDVTEVVEHDLFEGTADFGFSFNFCAGQIEATFFDHTSAEHGPRLIIEPTIPMETYSISGAVTGDIPDCVPITFSGDLSGSTIADSSGNYIFSNLPEGTYTVTPAKYGYTFTPSSRQVVISKSDVTGVDFIGSQFLFSISGTVTHNGSGESNITIGLSGDRSGSTKTDSSGNYIFSGLSNGTYTIAPTSGGYTFAPSSIQVTINEANQTGINFTATKTLFTVSGKVTGMETVGVGIYLSGTSSESTWTDYVGGFKFSGLSSGTYTVIPHFVGYVFAPSSRTVTISVEDVRDVDFVSTNGYTIYGSVTEGYEERPIPDVSMNLSGDSTDSTLTDNNGNYYLSVLQKGSYTVTPSKAGYTFSPESRQVVVSGSNVNGVDFIPSQFCFKISGTVTLNSAGRLNVPIILTGDDSGTTYTDWSGNFTFGNLRNGTYTVTPSEYGVSYAPSSRQVTIDGKDQTDVNFIGTQTIFSISGNVTGDIQEYVTMDLSGSSSGSVYTNDSGYYTFYNLSSGTYTVTPTYDGCAFIPPSRTITIPEEELTDVNFESTKRYNVSGRVTQGWGENPIEGVALKLTGDSTDLTLTNDEGDYYLSLPKGTYIITPDKPGYKFQPRSKTIAIRDGKRVRQDFRAWAVPAR